MTISASMVKDLREKTGAGMMDCKAALIENNGDVEAAIDWLRTKGLAKAAKKAGRVAAEGLVGVAASGAKAVVVEVNSETDFVARNAEFQQVVQNVAQAALATDGAVASVAAANFPGSDKTVEAAITTAVATIGEHMGLRRSAAVEVTDGVVASYVHSAVAPNLGKIGVLVGLQSTGDKDKLLALGRQVAMHIAATNPLAVRSEELDADVVARERAVYAEQARESGKPEAIIEKMVEGRVRKFYEEVVLLSQAFVINPDLTVEKALKAAEADVGAPIELTTFVSFRLGEGVEKEESDFAAEVAAAAGTK
ncbi:MULTISPECIES: translation elongation factor Ts [Kaistia]|uniref:Elongation factor Ts n=1 Tax=Kaistia nematophila TaxID=2994654 RepID=A0A9X3E5H9_9HYPH|nr:translation elongation factor Ts [Kaistia nematophila]MBN9024854.1 elongation factor Ts [Hyphomicrobiales bacterium]MCX5571117.1 translation elongation factor Ts [Kaistia nematophila]